MGPQREQHIDFPLIFNDFPSIFKDFPKIFVDFPSIFGHILEVVLELKSAQDATLTHCGELQEQFLTPMKGVKFQTSVKSAR